MPAVSEVVAREAAQWQEHLLCKLEDLAIIPHLQTHTPTQRAGWSHTYCNLSAGGEDRHSRISGSCGMYVCIHTNTHTHSNLRKTSSLPGTYFMCSILGPLHVLWPHERPGSESLKGGQHLCSCVLCFPFFHWTHRWPLHIISLDPFSEMV